MYYSRDDLIRGGLVNYKNGWADKRGISQLQEWVGLLEED